MMIMLTGVDGTGKSTLAKQLAKSMHSQIVRFSQPKPEDGPMLDMYMKAIQENDNVVFDRGWYCEVVYGTVMRGVTQLSPMDIYKLEQAFAAKGGLVIHCTGNLAVVWNRLQRRGEDYVKDINTLSRLAMHYEKLLYGSSHLVPIVEYTIAENARWVP